MNTKIAGGVEEGGVVVGNYYDKYGSRNPIVRWMVGGFESALSELVAIAAPETINEIGCGEGHWVMRWNDQGLQARGCDFSKAVIEIARENAAARGMCSSVFDVGSIYDLDATRDSASLLVCCEVLEHLENPEAGLAALQRVVTDHVILSVPREPLWCALNLMRGKYIKNFGNTPGHIQHWTRRGFVELVAHYFEIIEERNPLPWTILLCRRI